MNDTVRSPGESAHPPEAADGIIMVDETGNVTVGAPTAVAVVVIPTDEDPED